MKRLNYVFGVGVAVVLSVETQAIFINSPPSIGLIPDQTIFENTPLSVPILVNDPDPGQLASLQVSATSLTPSLFSTLLVAGSGNVRTLSGTPIFDQVGVATIQVEAMDSLGAFRIATFRVDVEPTPPAKAREGGSTAALAMLGLMGIGVLRRNESRPGGRSSTRVA